MCAARDTLFARPVALFLARCECRRDERWTSEGHILRGLFEERAQPALYPARVARQEGQRTDTEGVQRGMKAMTVEVGRQRRGQREQRRTLHHWSAGPML